MSREHLDAVDAFTRRIRRPTAHGDQPDGPAVPARDAVEPPECGPDTDVSTRAAAAALARMRDSESDRE